MNYCSSCGAKTHITTPEGDHAERTCCTECNEIFYINPKIIVGCLPLWDGKVMLCKRGIEPRKNYWTLPGGFMENNETTLEGALRETWEETKAKVTIEKLHGVYNIPQINQVYFFYLAHLDQPKWELTPESIEIKLFELDDIPWADLAFLVVKKALEQYVNKEPTEYPNLYHSDIRMDRKKLSA